MTLFCLSSTNLVICQTLSSLPSFYISLRRRHTISLPPKIQLSGLFRIPSSSCSDILPLSLLRNCPSSFLLQFLFICSLSPGPLFLDVLRSCSHTPPLGIISKCCRSVVIIFLLSLPRTIYDKPLLQILILPILSPYFQITMPWL